MNTLRKHHMFYNIFLGSIILLGISLALMVSYDRKLQFLSIMITAFFYLSAGIVHHIIHHNLTSKIVIEYVLIASLAVIIVFFVLNSL